MNNIRLDEGRYVARTNLVVSLMQGSGTSARQVEYREVKAGEEFEVPAHVNHFWSAVTYYPEFDDKEPKFDKVSH